MSDRKISFRNIQAQDESFLRLVYKSIRVDELATTPWTEEQKEQFLRFQFNAQHIDYTKNYPNAQCLIIELDTHPSGRLYVDRTDAEIHILDIALLTPDRGQGIGSTILKSLLDEASTTQKTVLIYVEKLNPALRLYQRLGFQSIEEGEVYLKMSWTPQRGTA